MIDFNYAAHGLTLSLAWFVTANLAMSLLIAATARVLLRRGGVARPGWWFLLRLAPAIASTTFVLVFFVPSYWKYEPRESVEGFDLTLSVIAAVAVVLVAASLVRGVRAWRSAAARVGRWVRHASILPHLPVAGTTPVFVVDSDQPIIALSGIRRPRLLVTRGFVQALTRAELTAAIAHELGHRRAWDNLKRLAMRSAPDFLRLTPAAHDLERRWASAAEHAADRVAGSGPSARCALASALVKVARLTPRSAVAEPAYVAEPISTLIGGGEITSRVQRLLDDRDPIERRPRFSVLAPALAAAAIVFVTYGPLVRAVHDATERLIRILP